MQGISVRFYEMGDINTNLDWLGLSSIIRRVKSYFLKYHSLKVFIYMYILYGIACCFSFIRLILSFRELHVCMYKTKLKMLINFIQLYKKTYFFRFNFNGEKGFDLMVKKDSIFSIISWKYWILIDHFNQKHFDFITEKGPSKEFYFKLCLKLIVHYIHISRVDWFVCVKYKTSVSITPL